MHGMRCMGRIQQTDDDKHDTPRRVSLDQHHAP